MRATFFLASSFFSLGLAAALPVFGHGDEHSEANAASAEEALLPAQHSIRVESGFRIEGPGVIKLKRGDQVEVDFVTDTADELHLHGYDITVNLQPNETSRLSFKAKYAGRFSFELHESDREIGVFEVHP